MPPTSGQPRPSPRPTRAGTPHLRLVYSALPEGEPVPEAEATAEDPAPPPLPRRASRPLNIAVAVVTVAAATLAVVLLAHTLGGRGWYRLALVAAGAL